MGNVAPIQRISASLLFLLAGALSFWVASGAEPFRLDAVVQAVQQRYGGNAGATAKDWSNALTVFQGGSEQQKLKDVNEYFNRKLRFEDDQKLWGQNDYWATPIEALLKGAGDCEDYAIAKYFSLKHVGVPVAKLRITYVKARIGGPSSSITQAHMVLTYYSTPDAEPLVLDNLVGEIRPSSRRTDLTPIFSFNTEGVWAAGSAEPQQSGGSRLSRWIDLLEKMKNEGFD
jgi:predicted transglutaminase-like cysteine proteinase